MILTSDYATFYSLPPLPPSLIPLFVRKKKKYPPYGLRKVESITNGVIVLPSKLEKYVKKDKVVGIYVNDPLALTDVGQGLTKIFHDKPAFYYSFISFKEKIVKLKDKYGLKVVVGGPGSWELKDEDWIDYLVIGEAEKTLPKILSGEVKEKIVYGEPTDTFYPVKGPSAMAEVEVKRKNRKVPLQVVKEELKIQSVNGYVNLISNDFLSYGEEDEVINLLRLASSYGRVRISQISVHSSLSFNLSRIKETLKLNEKNWISPLLSTKPGVCTLSDGIEALKELNKNYIYPMIYSPSDNVEELLNYKAIIIPLPVNDEENFYEVLYKCWLNNKKIINFPFSHVIDKILEKAKDTKGEYLRKLRLNGFVGLINLLRLLVLP